MASLSIRKLDDETCERLRARAAQHGVSMEEEVRQILKRAVAPPERTGDLFLKVFGPDRGADLEFSPREPHEPMHLDPESPRAIEEFLRCHESQALLEALNRVYDDFLPASDEEEVRRFMKQKQREMIKRER